MASKETRDMSKRQGRPLWFPKVEDFGDLFEKAGPSVKSPTCIVRYDSYQPRESVHVSSHCSVRGGDSLDVIPTAALIAKIQEELCIPGDLSFEVVVRAGGEALILVKYSQILASRWIAVVPASTVPFQEFSSDDLKWVCSCGQTLRTEQQAGKTRHR